MSHFLTSKIFRNIISDKEFFFCYGIFIKSQWFYNENYLLTSSNDSESSCCSKLINVCCRNSFATCFRNAHHLKYLKRISLRITKTSK